MCTKPAGMHGSSWRVPSVQSHLCQILYQRSVLVLPLLTSSAQHLNLHAYCSSRFRRECVVPARLLLHAVALEVIVRKAANSSVLGWPQHDEQSLQASRTSSSCCKGRRDPVNGSRTTSLQLFTCTGVQDDSSTAYMRRAFTRAI